MDDRRASRFARGGVALLLAALLPGWALAGPVAQAQPRSTGLPGGAGIISTVAGGVGGPGPATAVALGTSDQ
jgi:hypothetical protein